ncbi:MAG: DUF1549 and DUF1553 domain-containing protein [Candidatus Hydrogenedentes bacterium]|nr:DUF1549 and DUF1553 domain-containing protein [Candidatus Hydrogenedentota bacterium]
MRIRLYPPVRRIQSAILAAAMTMGIATAAHTEAKSNTTAPPKDWAFHAPERPTLPSVDDPAWSDNPIDAFVYQKLADQNLTPSTEAERRVLIRRLYLDVLGLSPTPEEVASFLNDTAANAYENLVNQVLASPHYGERWARHWLDVVGFAETDGFETNVPRPNAWRYRDYVIQAINDDIPYTQFIKEQLAGDALDADRATGYLVAGAKDIVKSPDIVLTKNQRDGELHDMVNRTSAAFLGLTAGCAKCHDHKFDPISQRDYYQLRAVFAGVQHGDRDIRPDDYGERMAKAEKVTQKKNALARKLADYTPKATVGLTAIDDDGPLFQVAGAPKTAFHVRPMDHGIIGKTESDPGERYTIWQANTNQVLFSWMPAMAGDTQVYLSWCTDKDRCAKVSYLLDADGNPATTEDQTVMATINQKLLASQEADATAENEWSGFFDAGRHTLTEKSVVLLRSDDSSGKVTADVMALRPVADAMDASPPALRPQLRQAVTAQRNEERFVPIEATALRFTIHATNGNRACIDELEVYAAESGENIALASAGAVPSASGEYGNEKHRTVHLNDGKHGNSFSWIPGQEPAAWAQIDFSEAKNIDRVVWGRDREGKFKDRLATQYTIEAKRADGTWQAVAAGYDRAPFGIKTPNILPYVTGLDADRRTALTALQKDIKTLDGEHATLTTFERIYGGKFVEAEPTHFLYRGDPMAERDLVNPGGIAQVGTPLQLASDVPEQQRRVKLADWIASDTNPLTARVMVNRIWHYHFGRGIVETPSDFGAMGTRPTHPELLDWLATTFMEEGWHPKALHRRILLSRTYRQSSTPRPDALIIDAGSRYLWRFPPRRLEAEPIRDTVLQTSGVLDLAMGGPGYSVFKPNENYVRVYDPKVDFGPSEWRRMIYQMKPRMEQDETFGIFDCPDGAQFQPKRNASTTPLQALNMLNSPFMNQQAKLFAERLRKDGAHAPNAQAERAFQLAYAREATPEELAASDTFIQEHGLTLFCRAIYNTNEFLYLN